MSETPDERTDRASEQLDQLQEEDTLVDRGVDDVLDEGYSPPEKWSAAEQFGNTAEEQARGESLDRRLEQEEPDVFEDTLNDDYLDDGEVGDARAGRLVDPNEGIGDDIDSELLGDDVGVDGAGASAEEAAVHIVTDQPADGDYR